MQMWVNAHSLTRPKPDILEQQPRKQATNQAGKPELLRKGRTEPKKTPSKV